MLTIKNLFVSYGERSVLNDLNLELEPGTLVMITGSNGAGKSTLFKAVTGMIPINGGQIYLGDENITDWSPHKRAQNIAQVLQDPLMGTIGHMTIAENLSFALRRGKRRFLLPCRTPARLALFKKRLSVLSMGLEDRLDDLVSNLSGGQRQALSLVMATMVPPKLLLLDEITSALDPNMAERVMQLTQQLVRTFNCTALIITHNLDQAKTYGNRTVML